MNELRSYLAHWLLVVAVVVLTIIMLVVLWVLPEREADELKKEFYNGSL